MTAKVIDFPRSSSRTRGASDDTAREIAISRKRHVIERLRSQVSNPRQRNKKVPLRLTPDEAVRVAQRLGEDLQTIRSRGRGHMQSVLEKAGVLKTNRQRYALLPGELPKGRPVLALRQYVILADAIAGTLGTDADLHLHDVLEHTRFITRPGASHDQEALELCAAFEAMARFVARSTNLIGFFDQAANTAGQVDPFGLFRSSTMHLLRDRAFENSFDHCEEVQPLPNVPLFRLLEQEFAAEAKSGPSFATYDDLGAYLSSKPRITGERIPVTVQIWREIGLTVGEKTGRGSFGAMFSGRSYVRCIMDHRTFHPIFPWALDRLTMNLCSLEDLLGANESGGMEAKERHVSPTTLVSEDEGGLELQTANVYVADESWQDTWFEPAPAEGEPDFRVEHTYFSYHAVSPWNVRRLLHWSDETFRQTELLLSDLGPELGEYRLGGWVGRAVEQALINGTLEQLLKDAVRELVGAMEAYQNTRRVAISQQDSDAFARWTMTRDSYHD
jgi:hypothetical protein